jgi:hypothetical protein
MVATNTSHPHNPRFLRPILSNDPPKRPWPLFAIKIEAEASKLMRRLSAPCASKGRYEPPVRRGRFPATSLTPGAPPGTAEVPFLREMKTPQQIASFGLPESAHPSPISSRPEYHSWLSAIRQAKAYNQKDSRILNRCLAPCQGRTICRDSAPSSRRNLTQPAQHR